MTQECAGKSANGNRPEFELLLACARTRTNPHGAERIAALLRDGIDWENLLRIAHRHGMMPILYSALNTRCPDLVPRAILQRLGDHFRRNAARNLFFTGELLEVLNLFQSHGIPAVPYKGPVLAASVHGDLSLREFGDLDILVHRQDILKVKDLLIARGYRPEYRLTPAQEAAHLRFDCEYNFDLDDKVHLEIHWRTAPRVLCPLDPDDLWERTEPLSFFGTTVLGFSPENMLLIFCIHGAKHRWERLNWVCDVAELIRVRHDLDWASVMKQARALGNERAILLGLLLANDRLEASLPDSVIRRIRADRRVQAIAREVDRLQLGLGETPGPHTPLKEYFFYTRICDHFQDEVRIAARMIWTPNAPDLTSFPLPHWLLYLYPFIRVTRFLNKRSRLSRLLELPKAVTWSMRKCWHTKRLSFSWPSETPRTGPKSRRSRQPSGVGPTVH